MIPPASASIPVPRSASARGRVARGGALLEIVRHHPPDPGDIQAAGICDASTGRMLADHLAAAQALLERGRRPAVVQQTERGGA